MKDFRYRIIDTLIKRALLGLLDSDNLIFLYR